VRPEFLDFSIFSEIARINITHSAILFAVAYLYFILLPRWLFPQRYAGAGLEKTISNILYILVFTELTIPLLVFLKIFSIISFAISIIILKLLFLKFYYRKPILATLGRLKDRILIALFDFFDHPKSRLKSIKKRIREHLYFTIRTLDYYILAKRILVTSTFIYLIYVIGYRCFIAMANPLSDTSQFFEWVASMKNNVLWPENKTGGSDFYGISVFIFLLHTLTNIDTIVLFNIYPLLLITFLLFLSSSGSASNPSSPSPSSSSTEASS